MNSNKRRITDYCRKPRLVHLSKPDEPYRDILVFSVEAEILPLTIKIYKVFVLIGINISRSHLLVCTFDTGVGLKLIQANVLKQRSVDNSNESDMPEIRGASTKKPVMSKTSPFIFVRVNRALR